MVEHLDSACQFRWYLLACLRERRAHRKPRLLPQCLTVHGRDWNGNRVTLQPSGDMFAKRGLLGDGHQNVVSMFVPEYVGCVLPAIHVSSSTRGYPPQRPFRPNGTIVEALESLTGRCGGAVCSELRRCAVRSMKLSAHHTQVRVATRPRIVRGPAPKN